MTILGRVLQEVLKEKKMSQTELANAIHRSAGFITHIISGRKDHVDPDLSAMISEQLGTPADFWSSINEDERNGTPLSVGEYLLRLDPATAMKPRHPGVLVDHEIRARICAEDVEQLEKDDRRIGIEGFDKARLGAASYDTVVGGMWLIQNGRERPVDANGKIAIPAGGHVKCYTKEFFVMPANIVGRIAPAWSFVRQGIVVAHGPLIDPGFKGPLTVMLHNFSGQDVVIDTSSRFLTIVFEVLASLPDTREAEPAYGAQWRETERTEADQRISELERQLAELRAKLETNRL